VGLQFPRLRKVSNDTSPKADDAGEGPSAPKAEAKAKIYRSDVLSLDWLCTIFPSKSRVKVSSWYEYLHSQEFDTMSSLGDLSEMGWQNLQLPLAVKENLRKTLTERKKRGKYEYGRDDEAGGQRRRFPLGKGSEEQDKTRGRKVRLAEPWDPTTEDRERVKLRPIPDKDTQGVDGVALPSLKGVDGHERPDIESMRLDDVDLRHIEVERKKEFAPAVQIAWPKLRPVSKQRKPKPKQDKPVIKIVEPVGFRKKKTRPKTRVDTRGTEQPRKKAAEEEGHDVRHATDTHRKDGHPGGKSGKGRPPLTNQQEKEWEAAKWAALRSCLPFPSPLLLHHRSEIPFSFATWQLTSSAPAC